MKQTLILRAMLGCLAFALVSFQSNAASFTAVASGNWSDASTWGGTAPGSEISSLDNVTIPSGITVTMDINVTLNNTTPGAFIVNGTLSSSANTELLVSQGAVTGSGTIDIYKLRLGSSLASIGFTGNLTLNIFSIQGTAATLASTSSVTDSLELETGSLTVGTGGSLTMQSGSVVHIVAGNLLVSGGTFTGNNHSVWYGGISRTSGVELNSSSLNNLTVDFVNNTQVLTLNGDVTVNGMLDVNNGRVAIAANTLTILGDFDLGSNGAFTGISSSELVLESSSLTGDLLFTPASSLAALEINLMNHASISLFGQIHIADELELVNGTLNLETGSELIMDVNSEIAVDDGSVVGKGGTFNGSASYNVIYEGDTDTCSLEISGTGLNNITLNLISPSAMIALDRSITVSGHLNLSKGMLSLNGFDLTLTGTYDISDNGGFMGHNTSGLYLNLSATDQDVLKFGNSATQLDELRLNIAPGGTITLLTGLTITKTLDLTKGRLDIGPNVITVTNSGVISNYNDQSYVITSGEGVLRRYVSANSIYTAFPVGNTANYSPAFVKQSSGASDGYFNVRTFNGVFSEGWSGLNIADFRSVVDRTWVVDADADVTNINMELKLGWQVAAHRNSFSYNVSHLSHYVNNDWDLSLANSANADNHNTYTQFRSFTSDGLFIVADNKARLSNEEVKLADQGGISVYPNPSAEMISIDAGADSKFRYELLDVTGKTLKTLESTEPVVRMDVSDLASGCYFIKAINLNNSRTISRQFIRF